MTDEMEADSENQGIEVAFDALPCWSGVSGAPRLDAIYGHVVASLGPGLCDMPAQKALILIESVAYLMNNHTMPPSPERPKLKLVKDES